MSDLHDLHALITGGGGGIGAAIAASLAKRGARVGLVGRDGAKLERVAATLPGAFFAAADVTDEAAIARAFDAARKRHGPLAILVNSAGAAASAPFAKIDRAHWDAMLGVNLTGAFFCAQAALPDMLAARWGRVVNIASTAGLKGYRYVAAYAAAKHGLIGLTRALALETAKHGVTVNALCPGFTDTDMVSVSVARIVETTKLDQGAARARLAAYNPQRRLIAPREVAETVAWLCSRAADGVNGAAIPIAGGEI